MLTLNQQNGTSNWESFVLCCPRHMGYCSLEVIPKKTKLWLLTLRRMVERIFFLLKLGDYLIRSVFSGILNYYMALFCVPCLVCKSLEKYIERFSLGGGGRRRQWRPFYELGDGGVLSKGVRNLQSLNS